MSRQGMSPRVGRAKTAARVRRCLALGSAADLGRPPPGVSSPPPAFFATRSPPLVISRDDTTILDVRQPVCEKTRPPPVRRRLPSPASVGRGSTPRGQGQRPPRRPLPH